VLNQKCDISANYGINVANCMICKQQLNEVLETNQIRVMIMTKSLYLGTVRCYMAS